jgi:intron-binding protein aquarius
MALRVGCCCHLQDTFLDAQHLIDSFPQYDVAFSSGSSTISTGSGQYDAAALPAPPYKVTFPADQQQLKSAPGSTKRGADATATTDAAAAEPSSAAADGSSSSSSSKPVLLVEHYRPINMGPYPEDKPTGNEVRFTSVQVEAVAAGVQPGLTMVVGPPGTGKTDTAVQILQVRLVVVLSNEVCLLLCPR